MQTRKLRSVIDDQTAVSTKTFISKHELQTMSNQEELMSRYHQGNCLPVDEREWMRNRDRKCRILRSITFLIRHLADFCMFHERHLQKFLHTQYMTIQLGERCGSTYIIGRQKVQQGVLQLVSRLRVANTSDEYC